MWIALGIIIALAVALYLYLAVTCFFTGVTFMTAYQVEYRASGSHAGGLRAAMNVFKGRAPFNVLTISDLNRALNVLSLIPDARAVARIIQDLDRKRDASLLANEVFLSQLETEYRRMPDPSRTLNLIPKAEALGVVLKEYIAIHNDVFKFKWRRMLPLGSWFEAIDFHGNLVALKSLEEELKRIRDDIPEQDCRESPFALILVTYSATLEEAMCHLRRICAGLDCKRTGSDTYRWSEYQRDTDEYNAKVRDYQVAGADLNREMELIRSGIAR